MFNKKRGDLTITLNTGYKESTLFISKEIMQDREVLHNLLPDKILEEYKILLEREIEGDT